jgi:hypothetical protein
MPQDPLDEKLSKKPFNLITNKRHRITSITIGIGKVSSMMSKRIFLAFGLLWMIFIALNACTGGKYGRLTATPEIKRSFEAYEVLPNHKYFYRGAQSKPTVIVGINQNYQMNLKLWVPLDPESAEFRTQIDRVSLQGMGNIVEPWGFRILDSDGDDVGVWYSAIRVAAVAITEDRQIVKLQPGTMVAMGDQLR